MQTVIFDNHILINRLKLSVSLAKAGMSFRSSQAAESPKAAMPFRINIGLVTANQIAKSPENGNNL